MKPSLHLRRLPLVRPLVWAAALTTLAVVPAQAQSLLQLYDTAHGFERVANVAGGIDAWSLQVDPSVPRY